MPRSWKLEVQTDSSGHWASSAVRLTSREETEAYGRNLYRRWTLVREFRATETDDEPNYWCSNDGELKPYDNAAQLAAWEGHTS